MATEPSDLPATSSPRAGAARYRAALLCAILRKESGTGHDVLGRWSWLLPRIIALLVVGPLVSLAGVLGLPRVAPAPTLGEAPCIASSSQELEPVVVMITKSQILVGDDPTPVVVLPARDQLVQGGVDAKYKHGGASDMIVVPLADALARARGAACHGHEGEACPMEAIVVADATTPYRLLVEVLFTLGYSDVGKYHLMVRAPKK